MATCSSLINRALRKLGRLGAGRDARTNDAQDALDVLRGMYTSWITSGTLGRLSDVIVNGDATANEGMRVIRPVGVAADVTLPETIPANYPFYPPPYGSMWPYPALYEGVDPNVRAPSDGSVVSVIDQATGTAQTWIYDGNLKFWAQIDGLTLNDQAPLSSMDPDGFAAALAVEASDQFAADVSPVTMRAANRFIWTLANKTSMPRQISQGAYF